MSPIPTWLAPLCALTLAACSKAPSTAATDPPSTDRESTVSPSSASSAAGGSGVTAPAPPQGSTKVSWSERLGQTVTVVGTARNLKLGALLETPSGDLWVDGLQSWPDELSNQPVRVTGKLIERSDLPVFEAKKPSEPQISGMPVPPGTDLEQARRRYLLTEASWKAAE